MNRVTRHTYQSIVKCIFIINNNFNSLFNAFPLIIAANLFILIT